MRLSISSSFPFSVLLQPASMFLDLKDHPVPALQSYDSCNLMRRQGNRTMMLSLAHALGLQETDETTGNESRQEMTT